MNLLFILLMAGLQLMGISSAAMAADEDHSVTEEPAFNAGKYVIEHVSDAYEWHITTIGHLHITVPLPVIVYSKNMGLHVFMSSKFHHGHDSYNSFAIAHEGPYEGKIVELDDSGNIAGRPWDFSITKTVAGGMVASILILVLFLGVARNARNYAGNAPRGFYNLVEPVIIFIRDEVAVPAIGEHKSDRFMPFLLTMFFFILINNLLGLIPVFPFGANVTGNISVTLVFNIYPFPLF